MKIALAMICKGSDDEAELLQRCLQYTAPYVDSIYLTITHFVGEELNHKVSDVAKEFGAIVSHYQWGNDFASARNFNFSTVPKECDYILWLDADDVPRGLEKLKPTIESHPEVDVFSMFYLYAFDEHKNPIVVHQKTRVVKNDGCVSWAGLGLHEDFKENRALIRFAVKGIEILHLSTEPRLEISRQRNYLIATEWTLKTPDDPRTYWNLGNAAFGVGKHEEALTAFDKFLALSQSDEEKYIARQRRADVYWSRGDFNTALDEARYAIGLKPEYPDAYHLAGRLFYDLGKFDQAKDMFLNGLGRPARPFQIIVYNPRDYDYAPLMNLAKTYYALNLPQLALPALEAAVKITPADAALKKTIRILKKEAKEGDEVVKLCSKLRKITDKEKLAKELAKIPEKFKFHPEVLRIRNTSFVKETSSGKDLVIFCGFTEEEWTPESIAQKGSGGSEEAAITLAQGLADRGWTVTVYNNCGTDEHLSNNVVYKPYMAWNYRDKQDVTILWRQTKPLDWEINSTKIYVDMHDVIPSGEFTPARIDKLDKVFFKSKWHRELFPAIPDYKAVVIPNGINTAQYGSVGVKDPLLMINTASPVRSLTALIDIMKEVRKEVPDAKMKWAYGWITTDKGMRGQQGYPEWKAKTIAGMKDAGIEDLGRLNHTQIADLYLQASLYIYPTGFPEIDCISLTKTMAAGCFPITTDYAALGEKMGHGGEFIHWPYSHDKFTWYDMAINDEEIKKQFVEKIIYYLKNPPDTTEMRDWARSYDWDSIIDSWNTLLCE